LRLWSPRAPQPSDKRTAEGQLLRRCTCLWGTRATHLFDQGFAGGPWLGTLLHFNVRAVLRWSARYHLFGRPGPPGELGPDRATLPLG
jgi:hypothetical protein